MSDSDQPMSSEEIRQAKLAAWYRGINPYPLLTMDESWYLLVTSDGLIRPAGSGVFVTYSERNER